MWLARLTICTAVLVSGCGLFINYPDRRNAQVVAHDPILARHVQFSLDWWDAATGQIGAELSESCDGDHSCVYVVYANLPAPLGGQNQNWENIFIGEIGSRIKIDVEVDDGPNLRHVIAHELGHSFEMPHTSGNDTDLMRPSGFGPSCIDDETIRNWKIRYGNSDDYRVVCSFELDEPK